ncbi:hypothetical protein PQX77_021872 [Marasmius sp. AFHP31]|nr:hypothetical protein PQX77_021872 [Marasmius sp. AFHP31]
MPTLRMKNAEAEVEVALGNGMAWIIELYSPTVDDTFRDCVHESDISSRHVDLQETRRWLYRRALSMVGTKEHVRYESDFHGTVLDDAHGSRNPFRPSSTSFTDPNNIKSRGLQMNGGSPKLNAIMG